MIGAGIRVALALSAALFLGPERAAANDSTGFQGTGGIELTSTDAIEMVSEDLRIGLDEIRVAYVFRNVSAQPVETMVAFPLPELDLSRGLTEPGAFHSRPMISWDSACGSTISRFSPPWSAGPSTRART